MFHSPGMTRFRPPSRPATARTARRDAPGLGLSDLLTGLLVLAILAIAISSLAAGGGSGTARSPAETATRAPGRLIDQVTRIRDGDTIVVGLIPIRIANLDCAEKGTVEGEAATARMRSLVAAATLTCALEGRRSWDREVGTCALADGRDIGEVMIAEGFCARWH